jgi:bifunctional non-homologous end joining protein LigD
MTEVRLTSADRVLFPEDGITKGDLFEYYGEIAPVIVPHLRNRPFTMKRWREGIRGGSFFQKQAPKGLPSWVKTRRFTTHPREGGSRLVDFVLVNDEPTLLSMVQMHCIDMNAWYSRVDKPHRPDFVLFDLDPPEGLWREAIEVAHLIRGRLEELGLESHVKTSGSTGIHVLVPIARRSTFEDTYEFAELVSRGLAEEHDGLVTVEWLKEKRRGVLRATTARRARVDPAPLEGVEARPGLPRLHDGRRARSREEARRSLRAGPARDTGTRACAPRGQEERCRARRSARRASPRSPSQIGVSST